MASKFVIGIDLGTTNSAMAYAEVNAIRDPHHLPPVSIMPVPQLTNPGEVRDEPLLPSFLYIPGQTEPNLAALYFATESKSSSPYSPIPSAREMPPAVIQEAAANVPARSPADRNVPGPLLSETGSSAGSCQLVRLDLTNERAKQELAQGFHLKNGDAITIEDRKLRPIYVVGMVNKPGEYAIPVDRDIRLLEAIGLAGGVDRSSLPSRVLVIRQRADGSGVLTVRIDLNKAKVDNAENIRLMPGDTISVEETVASYMRSLLRGAVRFGVGATVTPAYGF